MRLGEILALRWNDIDFDKKIIYVKNTIKRVTTHNSNGNKTEIILDTPKTENSFRIIPLIDEMIKELKAHIKMQNKEKQVSGSAYRDKTFYSAMKLENLMTKKLLKIIIIKYWQNVGF